MVAIAQSLNVPYRTVRNWWRRFRMEGEAGLQTHYDQCGPKQPKTDQAIHAAALTFKQEHPKWGGGLIRVELQKQFPGQGLPHVRTLQRWWARAGLQPARVKRPPVERERGKEPHAVWQMDAKERMRLADGSGTSVLAVSDEASGALLTATPFPPVPLYSSHAAGSPGGVASAIRALGSPPAAAGG
jgi:transposase